MINGAIDRDAFEAYVKEGLVPELRPGDIVVMDNLSSHKRTQGPQDDRRRRRTTPIPAAL